MPNPATGPLPIPAIDLYKRLRGAMTPTDPGTRVGTTPLAPGSPGGAQTPMQLPTGPGLPPTMAGPEPAMGAGFSPFSSPGPTSLGPPQGGIDYGQSLENIMGQYQQQPPGFMPGAGRPIGPSHQGMQPGGVPPPPPTPTLQGLRQQAPTPRTSRFDQTSRPMNF